MRKVTPQEYVRSYMKVYRDGGTMRDLAEQLKIPYHTATVRASHYRGKGVNLPRLKRAANLRPAVDVTELNYIVEQSKA
jgi:hypothetical protein